MQKALVKQANPRTVFLSLKQYICEGLDAVAFRCGSAGQRSFLSVSRVGKSVESGIQIPGSAEETALHGKELSEDSRDAKTPRQWIFQRPVFPHRRLSAPRCLHHCLSTAVRVLATTLYGSRWSRSGYAASSAGLVTPSLLPRQEYLR